MSANEELQSTNEELHSVNEELYTLNEEYQKKIEELTNANNDLNNLYLTTNIGIVFWIVNSVFEILPRSPKNISPS